MQAQKLPLEWPPWPSLRAAGAQPELDRHKTLDTHISVAPGYPATWKSAPACHDRLDNGSLTRSASHHGPPWPSLRADGAQPELDRHKPLDAHIWVAPGYSGTWKSAPACRDRLDDGSLTRSTSHQSFKLSSQLTARLTCTGLAPDEWKPVSNRPLPDDLTLSLFSSLLLKHPSLKLLAPIFPLSLKLGASSSTQA